MRNAWDRSAVGELPDVGILGALAIAVSGDPEGIAFGEAYPVDILMRTVDYGLMAVASRQSFGNIYESVFDAVIGVTAEDVLFEIYDGDKVALSELGV